MYHIKNHNKIFYEIFGSGSKNFVLLHNAGGNHQFFHYQINALSKIGRVIAIDMLGHGYSDKPLKKYTLLEYAEDIVDICNHLNISNIVCIGLNYGASVLLQLTINKPELVSKLILIDPPLLMKPKIVDMIKSHISHLNDCEMTNYAETLVKESFIKTTKENYEIAISSFKSIQKEILSSIYTDLLEWDKLSNSIIVNLKTPSLCLLTNGSLCSGADLLQLNPQIEVGKVVGSLYWATLEVPDQVNSMILRFLEL
jgi:pimeloyl-ACP methyl ester carboxylesterase